MNQSELSIQTTILRKLRGQGAKVIKIHVDGYTEEGTPDLLGCYKGRSFAFEIKKPGEEPSAKQKLEIREWRMAGAVAEVVYSWQEAFRALGIPTPPDSRIGD